VIIILLPQNPTGDYTREHFSIDYGYHDPRPLPVSSTRGTENLSAEIHRYFALQGN
jgi:hypothetical protein